MPRRASTKSRARKSRQRPSSTKQQESAQPTIKEKRILPRFITLIVLIVVIGFGIWYSLSGSSTAANTQKAISTSATATATANGILPPFSATPTPVRTWQTFLTFTGNNGTKNTQTFTIPNDWLVTWTCQGIKGVDKMLNIVIYNANGSLYNAGEQAACLATQAVHGNMEEMQSGKVYLHIQSDTSWTINVEKIR